MSILPLLFLALGAAPDKHEADNPVYVELRQKGIDIGGKGRSLLPAPVMPDGLDAKAQRKVLISLLDQPGQLEEFTLNSKVAPQVIHIKEIKATDPETPPFSVEFYFVAYGDLDALAKKEFGTGLLDSPQKDRKVRLLLAEELAARKLKAGPEERYSHGVSLLLDRIELRSTNYSVRSRTPESIVIATQLDPRFADDREFPNQWRAVSKDANGKLVYGPVHPYAGSGSYIKITRLQEPAGALFVEFHQVYTEPKKWFGGNNVLRSKIRLTVPEEVRAFRQELKKLK
jgi:hypothetical protein